MKVWKVVEQCLKECVGEKETDCYRLTNSNVNIPTVFVEKLIELVLEDVASLVEDMDDGSRNPENAMIQDIKKKILNLYAEEENEL
jgi:hypothetical protein